MSSECKCVASSCCCDLKLRTGSLILGLIALIADTYGCIYFGIQAVLTGWWLLWMPVVVVVIHLVASFLILIGIPNGKTSFINDVTFKTYVNMNIAQLLVSIILFMLTIVQNGYIALTQGYDEQTGALILGLTLVYCTIIAVMIYFGVVINSFAISVEERYRALRTGIANKGFQVVVWSKAPQAEMAKAPETEKANKGLQVVVWSKAPQAEMAKAPEAEKA